MAIIHYLPLLNLVTDGKLLNSRNIQAPFFNFKGSRNKFKLKLLNVKL